LALRKDNPGLSALILRSGVYFVKVINEEIVVPDKIIIQ
jgi:hypothetical protein